MYNASEFTFFCFAALKAERSPLVSYYGAIAGLQELGPEVNKVFVLPHVKAISARIDLATNESSNSVMGGGGSNMEKIASKHIQNLIVKGCAPVVKSMRQPPDILEEYKVEFGTTIGAYLHSTIIRSRGSASAASGITSTIIA